MKHIKNYMLSAYDFLAVLAQIGTVIIGLIIFLAFIATVVLLGIKFVQESPSDALIALGLSVSALVGALCARPIEHCEAKAWSLTAMISCSAVTLALFALLSGITL